MYSLKTPIIPMSIVTHWPNSGVPFVWWINLFLTSSSKFIFYWILCKKYVNIFFWEKKFSVRKISKNFFPEFLSKVKFFIRFSKIFWLGKFYSSYFRIRLKKISIFFATSVDSFDNRCPFMTALAPIKISRISICPILLNLGIASISTPASF